ncbi:tetratricopeptide repeat protein [Leptolyngbya sp. PCC 6406]|uniref:tetratricopeptide repeat protein n=1 Tax=Leptolyngbya sp. PCC 6406 TaxID=1173264 RepID=UPI0002ACE2E6|nr:tetratricopeptide repeat protein [Leptolyngbya sp. PCC 6406]
MSGSGAAGGFDFQAVVGAFVAAHLLADDQLRWSIWLDLPISIAFEQGGAGDDIRIEFLSGDSYEVQVKRGLRADSILEEALIKMTSALKPQERGIIAVDPTSSGTVTQGLRNWLDGHRHGSPSSLPSSLIDRCQCLLQPSVQDDLERLHIIELDLEHSYSSHRRLAQALIAPLIQNESSSDAVMDTLVAYCHHLMTVRGKCDAKGFRDYLASRGHKLSPPVFHSKAQLVDFPLRLPKFIGRDTLLANIQNGFSNKASNFGQVLQGISGSGKSSIAAEYGFRSSNTYNQIIWLESSNILSAANRLFSIVGQTQSISGEKNGSLLVILDDLDDFKNGGDQLISTLGKLKSWHVLATSTNSSWSEFFHAIPVPSLDKDDAVKLLIGNLSTTDRDSADTIVEYVDRLPLALAQLSAYASKTLEPLSKILERLEVEGTRLFGHRPASLRTYKETVATCWHIILNKLEPESTKLLKLISFINPKEIPLDLITAWFEHIDASKSQIHFMSVSEATAGLSDWLIISRTESGIGCHRLMQEVVRESIEKEEIQDFLITLLDFFEGYLGHHSEAFRAYVRLKSHLITFLNCEQVELPKSTRANLYFTLSLYAWRDDLMEGLRLIDKSENLAREAGSEAASFLAVVLNMKGVICKNLGALEDASDMFREALQIARNFSDDTEALPAIIDNSAQVLQAKGETAPALNLYREALEIRQAHSANPDGILTSLSNVIGLLIEIGEKQEAKCHFDELINLLQQQVKDKLYSLNCVAICLKAARFSESLEDIDKAVELSLIALSLGRKIYGHGTRRYLEDALNSITLWLRIGKIDVLKWFIERSLLVLPESIRPVFWFNSASLCIVYGNIEIGVELLWSFEGAYASTEKELLQAVVKTARMLAENNEKNPGQPSFSFFLPRGVQLDLPSDVDLSKAAAVFVSWDTELHARVQDWS